MGRIVVLGAMSGIARALCYRLAAQKHDLIVAGRNVDELERLAADLSIKHEVNVWPAVFDALDTGSHSCFFHECATRFGELDGMIVAFGYMTEQHQTEQSFADARKVIDVNFVSCVSILHIAADYFAGRKQGFICAISSVAGDRGRQSNYTYGAAKAGLSVFMQGLRHRLAPCGVHVLTVKPGFVDTRMTYGTLKSSPLVARPERVADDIMKAIRRKQRVLYTPFFWRWIMLIIRLIPEGIFIKFKL